MKKLLLFALTMGVSAMSFAQQGKISIDAILEPSDPIIVQNPANGTTSIAVTITNNDDAFSYPASFTSLLFYVSVDGDRIDNPLAAGNQQFLAQLLVELAPGASTDVTLTTLWAPVGDPGQYDLCIDLDLISVVTTPAFALTNQDVNREICENFTFSWPLGVSDVTTSEISEIKTIGNEMIVFVKNSSPVTEIKLMSITGQVVKSISLSNGGQDFQEAFDISNLTSGLYIVSVQSENGTTQAQKVFVQ